MTSQVSSPLIVTAITLIAFVVLVRLVFADSGTSQNFKMNQSVNDFGNNATSASFQSVTTGGQFVTGEATSSSFSLSAGFEYYDSFTPRTENWRWYDDEGSETPTSAFENENVAPFNILSSNVIKLRVAVKETADIGASNVKFKLQFATSTDFSTRVLDVTEASDCTVSSVWCYADAAGSDNAVITTALLSDSDACVSSVGDGCGTHNESGQSTSTFTHKKSAITEYEFTIVASSTAANTTYFFRLFDMTASSAVPLMDGATYPSLSSEGGGLTFSISGLPSTTATAGVTTDITTTSTSVPFGTIPIGTSRMGAHRLSVSTNANEGYQIYAYQAQGLVGSGTEIEPVTGTNSTPSAWSSGCNVSATGCYGYHTAESVLSGGSTRFAADDTYAKFESSLEEVAYSATPVTNKTTDIVYRVEAHTLTPADSYSTNVTYIVVPVF